MRTLKRIHQGERKKVGPVLVALLAVTTSVMAGCSDVVDPTTAVVSPAGVQATREGAVEESHQPTFDPGLPNDAGHHAYVTGTVGDVTVVTSASHQIVSTVPVGGVGRGVAFTPDGALAYVAVSNPGRIAVIETSATNVVSTIPVGARPWGVAITPDGSHAYVANEGSNTVSVIATATNAAVATIGVGSNPTNIAITPSGAFAYVTNFSSHSVSLINTAANTVAATIGVGAFPRGVTVSPDGAFVYVVNAGNSTISVISTASNSVVATVAGLGATPLQIALTPDGSYAYVTNFSAVTTGNSVSVINTSLRTVVTTIPVGRNPWGVAVSPDGAFTYVANQADRSVTVISTASNAVVATIGSLSGANMVAFSPGVSAPVLIAIDLKPGSDRTSINCRNDRGVIPVAILTTPDFDATTVDHTTVSFEGAAETHVNKKTRLPRRHESDVDGDGDIDLVFHFRFGETELNCGSTEGTLTGETIDGTQVEGRSAVRMVGT